MIPAGMTGGAPSAAENTEQAAAENERDSTLGERIKKDGEYISDVLEPAGREEYTSKELLLINPWHLLPEDYEAELEDVEYGHRMDACAAEHLRDMLADCREAGYSPLICSSYRDRSKQEVLFQSDVRKFMYRGYSEEEAVRETAQNVAVPGSSEHEAGLAADIVYVGHQVLDESQEQNDTQQWLMEHCMEYGFILRYPRDKQDITGITYEPWHYRYVGEDAAREIMSRGICLEEYLGVIDKDSPALPLQAEED
jgi:D-alanyl-D-alanine carboxypeptidase